MGTEKSFRLFRRWVCILLSFCCFLLCLHKVNLLATTEPTMEERKTLNCPPGSGTTSGCVNTHCVASCGSEKVEMECPDGGIDINGSTVTCGKAKKVTFAPCFPFC